MGMPIRENQVCSIQVLISRPHLGRRDRSRLDHGGPKRVTTSPSGPYRLSLSRTMIIAPSGPYRPLFHTVSTAPSGSYSFLYRLLRFMQT